MKQALSVLLVFLALVGIADAGYITYEKLQGVVPPCGNGFDCGTVLNSPWASVGPIPLSAIGVAFYSWVLLLAVLNLLEISIDPLVKKGSALLKLSKRNVLRRLTLIELLLATTTFGAGFSAYLVFIMAVPIGGWCKYCLISAFTCASLFAITAYNYWKTANQSPFVLKRVWFAIAHFGYTKLIKPIFFLFDPELVHNTLVKSGGLLGSFGLGQMKVAAICRFSHPALEKTLSGVTFPNLVGLSAGFDYNGDLTQILPSVGFGWHTIGTVTLEAYEGNPKPRLARLPNSKALIVNKGLKNIGAQAIIKKLSSLPLAIPTAISIASTNKKFASDKEQLLDIVSCFKLFESASLGHKLYELNISCPNTFGGEPYTTPARLEMLLTALDSLRLSRPVFAKMPIELTNSEATELLKVLDRHQIAGVIFGNLAKNKKNPAVTPSDLEVWAKRPGNLGGKPTWQQSNDLVALTRKLYPQRFTIVGTGGIFSAEDAKQKLALGADLVQLITGMIFEGPETIGMINLELALTATERSD